jgi:hypothetical protein
VVQRERDSKCFWLVDSGRDPRLSDEERACAPALFTAGRPPFLGPRRPCRRSGGSAQKVGSRSSDPGPSVDIARGVRCAAGCIARRLAVVQRRASQPMAETAGSSVAAGAAAWSWSAAGAKQATTTAASISGSPNVLPPCVDQGAIASASVQEPHFTLIASSACATDGSKFPVHR